MIGSSSATPCCAPGHPGLRKRDAGIDQTLVLPIQGQVVGELVDQQAGEAHVRPAALDDAGQQTSSAGLPLTGQMIAPIPLIFVQ